MLTEKYMGKYIKHDKQCFREKKKAQMACYTYCLSPQEFAKPFLFVEIVTCSWNLGRVKK